MSMKKKSGGLAPTSEIDFLSSMSLEEATQRVAALADVEHPVTLTHISDDHYRFRLQYKHGGRVLGQISGDLRRWQGTMTRVHCSGRLPQDHHLKLLLPALASFSAVVVLFALATSAPQIALLLVPAALLANAKGKSRRMGLERDDDLYEPDSSSVDKERIQSQRITGMLLDAFIQLFKQHGSVELLEQAYGP